MGMNKRHCDLKCEYAKEIQEIVGIYTPPLIYCKRDDIIVKKGKLCLEQKIRGKE